MYRYNDPSLQAHPRNVESRLTDTGLDLFSVQAPLQALEAERAHIASTRVVRSVHQQTAVLATNTPEDHSK